MILKPEYWRSILFVPANNQKFIKKSMSIKADAIQLDLEDSIAYADKRQARKNAVTAAKLLHDAGKNVSVRINQPLSLAVRDIEAVVGPYVQVLALPKVLSGTHIKLLDNLVSHCEERANIAIGHTQFIVAIETLDAYYDMQHIALSSSRNLALMLGSEDMATLCECDPSEEVMRALKQQVVLAARYANIRPLGYLGSISNYQDIDAFESMVKRSKAYGFVGATC